MLFWTVLVTKRVLRGYVACSEGLTWRAFFRGAFFWARGGFLGNALFWTVLATKSVLLG